MTQILDTSIAIKWFVEEEGREKALQVLEQVINTPEKFAVPELFYFELAHVFSRVLSKPTLQQLELLDLAIQFPLRRFSLTPQFLREIRHFQRLGLSGYDSAYVALAKLLKGQWITFDKRAHEKIQHLKLSELF